MTNREFILKCINGLSDERLLDLWESIFCCSPAPIISACESCPHRDDEECFANSKACAEQGAAWMQREAVLRK